MNHKDYFRGNLGVIIIFRKMPKPSELNLYESTLVTPVVVSL